MSGRGLAVIGCLLVAVNPGQTQAEQPDEREAIRRGLAFVESKSMTWLHERKCASCHHVPMMVWAQRDARLRGFAIDEAALKESTEFLLAADNRANIFPKAGDPERAGNSYSMMAAYTSLAFRDSGKEPDPAAQATIQQAAVHVLSKQEADGSWKRFEGRPPIFPLQETTTLLAATVVGPRPTLDAELSAKAAKTRQWLGANSRGETQQELAWRILADQDRPASTERLLKLQNPDGGWSQTKEMGSDAYATGQTVYALVSRGGVDRSSPAIIKARDFLLATQQPEGSWVMTSRPPNSGTGGSKGAGNLEPITVAGSAWAVLGLLQRIPPVSP